MAERYQRASKNARRQQKTQTGTAKEVDSGKERERAETALGASFPSGSKN